MRYLRKYLRGNISIELPEVLRYLGYRKSKEDISPAIKEIIENQIILAYSLIKPRAIYSFIDNVFLKDYYIFKGAIKIALGICSIGSELEDLADSHFRKGAYLEWLVLDACGTVATENLVELVGDEIRSKASHEGLGISERLSPGCANWQLDGQNIIFDYFSGETVGVTINEAYMMNPRKSISFAYKLQRDGIEEARSDNCRHCELYRCSYRRVKLKEVLC
ncbi:MAG: hypothetical protein M1508_10270 [Nitrospirae bacterium]|nr:hypothetical protein [Nitrospirota bacterium]